MASLGNVRPKKGYSLMSESDGEDDQYEHCVRAKQVYDHMRG